MWHHSQCGVKHSFHHLINCMVGHTPFELKFKDISMDEMKFILNDLDHLYVRLKKEL